MSEERVWEVLCSRCEELFEKHGNWIVIPPCDPWDPDCEPLKVFDDTCVECNVWRFVVYILWLKKHPYSFHKYSLVKAERPELWKESFVKLSTL